MNLEILLDKIKVNVFALTAGTMILVGAGRDTYAEINNRTPFLPKWKYALALGCAVMIARYQNKRYHRLREHITEHGYNEDAAGLFMDRPCGRQVVKVTLQRTGHAEKYA